jgi:hypothetical protein
MSVLYMHVPKTGGTSIKKALEQSPNAVTENSKLIQQNELFHGLHIAVLNFKISNCMRFKLVLGDEQWNALWKVAMVRNPWDRYVSNWKWLTRKEAKYPKKGWQARGWMGEDGTISFDDFIRQMDWCYQEQSSLHPYQHDKWHLRNQIEHLIDESGNIMVDHIGRFESIDEEFNLICSKAGKKLDLPHLNHTGHYSGEAKTHNPENVHYSTYYTQELIDIVATRCKKDIETFNYDYKNEK